MVSSNLMLGCWPLPTVLLSKEMENYDERPLPSSLVKFHVVTMGVDDASEGRHHEEATGL